MALCGAHRARAVLSQGNAHHRECPSSSRTAQRGRDPCFDNCSLQRRPYARRSTIGPVRSNPPGLLLAQEGPRPLRPGVGHRRSRTARLRRAARPLTGPNIEGAVPVTLRINGTDRQLRIDPRTTLLDCLRETVALTGTKKGCDHGQCGACTVHVNGRRVNSCLSLAVMHDGEEVTTIEGLGTPSHALQAAFVACDGSVRYCTSARSCRRSRCSRNLRARRCGREGTDERQHLPMRGVSQHRGRDPASSPNGISTAYTPAESRSDRHEYI